MTRDQLDAIRARLDAATPGPWEAGTASCCPDLGWVEGPKGAVCPQFTATKVTHSLDANDAELIANAPTDLRALLDEVERLTAERDSWFLKGRHIASKKDVCPSCRGWGRLIEGLPPRTALVTCSYCWGSGDITDKGTDLREVRDERIHLQKQAERLTAERDAAFARGAEAMRTALLQRVSWGSDVADRIRAEPVPEDK
jgi:hypothetical protein